MGIGIYTKQVRNRLYGYLTKQMQRKVGHNLLYIKYILKLLKYEDTSRRNYMLYQ